MGTLLSKRLDQHTTPPLYPSSNVKMFKQLLEVVALANILSAQRPESCFDFGECVEGILLGASQASDVNDCLGICGDTDGCAWMTYYADPSNPDALGSCFMYEGQCRIAMRYWRILLRPYPMQRQWSV